MNKSRNCFLLGKFTLTVPLAEFLIQGSSLVSKTVSDEKNYLQPINMNWETNQYFLTPRRALIVSELTLGKDHAVVASICKNMSQVHNSIGNVQEAMDYYDKALEIRENGMARLLAYELQPETEDNPRPDWGPPSLSTLNTFPPIKSILTSPIDHCLQSGQY